MLISQNNIATAGSVMICNNPNSVMPNLSSNALYPNTNLYCPTAFSIGVFESNTDPFNSNAASIGVGIDAKGQNLGTLSFYGSNIAMKTHIDMENHQIKKLADGVAITDAVNLGQLNRAKSDAIAQGKTYTDTTKMNAIAQGKTYTDTAKADAIAQGKTYTDTAKTEAITTSNAYTDVAKMDALAQGKTYTDTAKTEAIITSNGYTDAAKADAIAQGKTYTDTAKTEVITTSNAYTDAAKSDAIAQGKTYTDAAKSDAIQRSVETSNTYTNQVKAEVISTINSVRDSNINSNTRDAITSVQLNTINQNFADFLGAGATYNSTTQNFKGPTFKVNGTNYYNVGDALEALDSRIDGVFKHVTHLQDQLEQGLAMSAAMAGLFQPYHVGNFNVSIAVGGYGRQGAVAVGSGFRFNQNVAIKAGLARGKASYNVGMNFEW